MLDVAGRLFATRGFGAVSTREIAKAAAVNLSAISYHFDSKEGLYRAVFEKLVRDLKPLRMDLALLLEQRLASAGGDRRDYADMMEKFVARLVDDALSDDGRWRTRLILRELDMPGEGFHILMDGHINVIADLLAILVARLQGGAAGQAAARLDAALLLLLCLQQAGGVELIKARVGWQEFAAAEREKTRERVTKLVLTALGLP